MNETARLKIGGETYVVVPAAEYDRLTVLARAAELPALPKPDADGNYPAAEYARASFARKVIRERVAAGLTQRELARRAGIRFETLCRIEGGRVPTIATAAKLERALGQAGKARPTAKKGGKRR